MDEQTIQQLIERLGQIAEALSAKVDRIVATIDEQAATVQLQARIAELEQANAELKAQSARASRKTLSPLVSALLAKTSGAEPQIDPVTLDKALAALSVEQRIAVKAEMARAGIIE
jgi:hypothetical protein